MVLGDGHTDHGSVGHNPHYDETVDSLLSFDLGLSQY